MYAFQMPSIHRQAWNQYATISPGSTSREQMIISHGLLLVRALYQQLIVDLLSKSIFPLSWSRYKLEVSNLKLVTPCINFLCQLFVPTNFSRSPSFSFELTSRVDNRRHNPFHDRDISWRNSLPPNSVHRVQWTTFMHLRWDGGPHTFLEEPERFSEDSHNILIIWENEKQDPLKFSGWTFCSPDTEECSIKNVFRLGIPLPRWKIEQKTIKNILKTQWRAL